jgi:hypothetical protein
MTYTRFPNGVSASTVEQASLPAAGEGNFYGDLFIGQNVIFPIMFASSSAAQTLPVAIPFAANIISAFVTVGSVSAVAAAYTVQVGSAGSIAVASVSNTVTTSFANESLALTTVAVTSAVGVKVIRGVQGTAGETMLTLLLKRTS